ncbi:MAG: hypothetical protein GF329_01060 [Candidatus Lokiarchaeota archaeon]|nr:hypothetical protein [Candidatus Lokiarchaeota archaeon]
MSRDYYAEHQVLEKFYSLNFDLIKVSDSKASTLAAISGQSILIVAFLLGNMIFSEKFDFYTSSFFLVSIVFNIMTLMLCVASLTPRKFKKSDNIQPIYSSIMKYSYKEFISKLEEFVESPRSEDLVQYGDICYNIALILKKKMRYVSYATYLFVIGMATLAVAISFLIFSIAAI